MGIRACLIFVYLMRTLYRNNLLLNLLSKDGISENDAEMDIRAKEAVRSAINKAVICKKPVAKYDRVTKKAYIETADGDRKYV